MSQATITKSRKGIGGPKTPAGKARVKLNAMKTGLHAKSAEADLMISEAVGITFDEIHQEMIEHYQPIDPVESLLVRRIARCAWKLRIYEAMEDNRFGRRRLTAWPSEALEVLSILERRTDVQLHRAIQALTAKRKDARQEHNEKCKNKLNPHMLSSEERAYRSTPTLSSEERAHRKEKRPPTLSSEERAYRSAPPPSHFPIPNSHFQIPSDLEPQTSDIEPQVRAYRSEPSQSQISNHKSQMPSGHASPSTPPGYILEVSTKQRAREVEL